MKVSTDNIIKEHVTASFRSAFSFLFAPKLQPPCYPDFIMHRIFGIQDILDEIFSWLVRCEKVVVARVNRTWFRLVLQGIWWDVWLAHALLLLEELRPTCIDVLYTLNKKIVDELEDHVSHPHSTVVHCLIYLVSEVRWKTAACGELGSLFSIRPLHEKAYDGSCRGCLSLRGVALGS